MADNSLESIPAYLEQSLSPQYAKQAEKLLRSIESQPGFAINLLHIIASSNLSQSVRLAGAVFLKNLVRRKWIDEDGTNYLLPLEDVASIKSEIIDVMIKLPLNLQVQLGETISLIAESDFPHNWSNLIDNLVGKFSMTDFVNNKAILLVAHSIFKKWRPLFGSNELYAEIQLVLDKFAPTFLQLVVELDRLIDASQDNKAQLDIYFDNLLLLMQIYYDFNSQEIPEFFEDNMNQLMNIVHKYLIYINPLLIDSDEDSHEIEVLIKVKTSIIELISLYVVRYADVFEPLIQTFITSVWELINTFVTKQTKYDLLVVKSLQFLTAILKIENYQQIFQNETSINEIIEKIILPNIYFREIDQEIFEDEPLHYIRSDLEGSDFDSRRKSSTDFLRELKELNSELLTNSVMKYVNQFLSQNQDWRNKDTAIYLFSSLATKGSITTIGVTSTNTLVDVVKFFTDNIAQDLINSNTHAILQVDSIKYIYTFRNQLTKDQLLGILPRLITHLNGEYNPVVYTYAAITVEKLLTMTDFNTHEQVINKHDIEPYITQMLNQLFQLILMNNSTPEKLAENEFLMKCLVSILHTCEETLTARQPIITQLLTILQITGKNPSNPKFSHYIFESLGLLIKFGKDIPQYMDLIIPQLLEILSEDVQEFVPYTLQILAYLLENYPKTNPIPSTYANLIQPLLSPSVWAYRGNIPGITRLLIAIINHDSSLFADASLLPLLGVFQKLIASKVNDGYGFELLESILLNLSVDKLQPHLNTIMTLLLRRLSDSRTEKFVKQFVVFIAGLAVTPANVTKFPNSNIINGDFVVNLLDSVQSGVFGQIYQSFILTYSKTLSNLQDKKIVNIGLSYFVTCGNFQQNYANLVPATIEVLMDNLQGYSTVAKDGNMIIPVSTAPLSELDLNLSSFGSHFSKIVAIHLGKFDPVGHIKNNDFESIKLIIGGNLKKVNASYLNLVSNESQALLNGLLR